MKISHDMITMRTYVGHHRSGAGHDDADRAPQTALCVIVLRLLEVKILTNWRTIKFLGHYFLFLGNLTMRGSREADHEPSISLSSSFLICL